MTMAAETVAPKKTLKIKFSTQPREHISECGLYGQQSSYVRTWVSCVSEGELSHSKVDKPSGVSDGLKRCRPSSAHFHTEKRQKMDRGISQQCSAVIKMLIRHPAGWVFKEPVDPIKLNIPDYFTIIKKPMDLGTIKSKLDKKQYGGAEDFVADVRLIFSNAMLYNPPTNSVHQMAEELLEVFETQWRSLEEKANHVQSKPGTGKLLTVIAEEINDKAQSRPETPVHKSVVLKKPKQSGRKVMASSLESKMDDVKLVRTSENCVDSFSGPNVVKDNDGGDVVPCDGVKENAAVAVASSCTACGTSNCQCIHFGDSAPASSDLSYERPMGRDSCASDASKMDWKEKVVKTSKLTKSDQDSDGAVSALDDETVCHSSELAIGADSTSVEGWRTPPLEVQLSPTKALRAAMLKQRFADTILKAQHKTLHDNADATDSVKMRLEKERLEKRQQEERTRIEAQIKAAEAATRKREEMELRKQRERQREAARAALQKMEKTADIELNLEILRELEVLSGGSLVYSPRFIKAAEGEADDIDSPLKRLGLYIKDEADDEDEEVVNGDGEEGEILF